MKVMRAAGGSLRLGVFGILAGLLMSGVGARGETATKSQDPWWKHAVIYEIYPRSFQDSNGDGTGDLNGITERLSYLHDLGVDTIWIAPMFPSPQVDFGYDISDYEAVDPQYGTMADMDRLIAEARKHNIRVMLDMVLNHTSDKHKWFEESKSSKNQPKARLVCLEGRRWTRQDGSAEQLAKRLWTLRVEI